MSNANVSSMEVRVATAKLLVEELLKEAQELPEGFTQGCLEEAQFSLEMAESFILERVPD